MDIQYKLYDSLVEMLSPETLSELFVKPVTHVRIRDMTDHRGNAGSKLSYVDTDARRLVLKQMSMEYDWLMYATNDQRCRSVRLWQYWLLERNSLKRLYWQAELDFA